MQNSERKDEEIRSDDIPKRVCNICNYDSNNCNISLFRCDKRHRNFSNNHFELIAAQSSLIPCHSWATGIVCPVIASCQACRKSSRIDVLERSSSSISDSYGISTITSTRPFLNALMGLSRFNCPCSLTFAMTLSAFIFTPLNGNG